MKKSLILQNFAFTFKSIKYCFFIAWNSSYFYTIFRILYSILIPILNIISIYIFKLIIDIISGTTNYTEKHLINLFILSIFTNIFISVYKKFITYSINIHNEKILIRLNKMVLNKSHTSDIELFDSPSYYDKLLSIQRDINSATTVVTNFLEFINGFITFISSFIILFNVNKLFALIIIITTIPSIIVGMMYTKKNFKFNLELITDERQKNYLYRISTSKIYSQEIRLFNIGFFIENKFNKISELLLKKRKEFSKKQTIIMLIVESFPVLSSFIILLFLALDVFNNKFTIGDFTYYNSIINKLQLSITMLISSVTLIFDNSLKINNIFTLFSYKNKIISKTNIILKYIDSIEFKNVFFTYPNSNRLVLNNISFEIKKNDKIALVGENGAGKSTIIKLLLRFYQPDKGQILINGINIETYNLTSLRNHFSLYFQSSPNFAFTLKENIILDEEEAFDTKRLFDIMKISNFYFDYNKLNIKLDTYITKEFNQDGIELSIGQHQKLNLTKTFFRSASIYILDEPTANLDSISENKLFNFIKEEECKSIFIIITHNMNMINFSNKILFIQKNGTIIFKPFDELIKNNNFNNFIHGIN